MNQRSRRKKAHSPKDLSKKLKAKAQAARRLRVKIRATAQQMVQLKQRNEGLQESAVRDKISRLPPKQQCAILQCFAAGNRKSTKGMHYNKEWLLECLIMRMESPRLYEHVRREKILVLPSRTCLRKYMKVYESNFGFNMAILTGIKRKTEGMDHYKLHGGLVVDEMKLAESYRVTASGQVDGFVDLGQFTPESDKHTLCDHGLVQMFQPLTGSWHQIVGVFASRGSVKGGLLSKILMEAIILLENAGLRVDFVTCDGASWNRAMWRNFGISGSSTKIKSSVPHPVENGRRLFFLSDFPHLVKCIRNGFVKAGFNTPEGHVHVQFVRVAHQEDESAITLKVMPKITKSHVSPNNFEKMKVNYAFHLFSTPVIRGLFFYEEQVIQSCGNPRPTRQFVKRMKDIIEVMTSRTHQVDSGLVPIVWVL